ncbi:hypothetical protein M9X92_010376 [Pyricularia oryzae]|nr:hypothetical protein M9X92_010376 [Pyricularia oryzae]
MSPATCGCNSCSCASCASCSCCVRSPPLSDLPKLYLDEANLIPLPGLADFLRQISCSTYSPRLLHRSSKG